MTRRVKQLHQAAPENYVEINRADATELSVNSGDMVRVGESPGDAGVEGEGGRERAAAQGLLVHPLLR